MDLFASFDEHEKPVVTVEYGSIGPDLQCSRLAGLQRGD
jgi:hypothetical protein